MFRVWVHGFGSRFGFGFSVGHGYTLGLRLGLG
jgi:hypothetical protein